VGSGVALDPAAWHTWWELHKDPYLQLKSAIYADPVSTGSDDFFLGHGERPSLKELQPNRQMTRELVVPTLLAILGGDEATSVISSATVSIAKLGAVACGEEAAAVEAALRDLLDEGNQEISETAALCLGLFGRVESVTALTALLADAEHGRKLVGGGKVATRTRSFAAYGLGQLGRRVGRAEVTSFIAHALISTVEDETVPDEVALAALNTLAVLPLVGSRSLEAGDVRVSPGSSRAALIQWLGERCESSKLSDRVRAHAPRAMAVQATKGSAALQQRAAELLVEVLKGGRVDRELRYGAVMGLGLLGHAGPESAFIKEGLMSSFSEGDSTERHLALMSLGQITSRPGPSASSAWESADEVEEFLRSKLARGKSRAKPWVALALGVQGAGQLSHERSLNEVTRDALRTMSRECRSPADAGAYAIAIGLRADIGASELLSERLASFSDDQSRGDLSLALGLLGQHGSVPALQEIFSDAVYHPHLFLQVVKALTLCGDKSLVPTLVKEMDATDSSSVRAVYAWALGHVGDGRAIEPLVELLKDEEQSTMLRIQVANGLGFVCDEEELPWSTSLKQAANYLTRAETLLGGSPSGVLEI
jgi:HEAT repeat protein